MSFERIAEEKIRQAMQAGQFEHLRGKGQPLQLEPENPHQAEDSRLAHHLLRQNGYSLPWIELNREIEGELQDMRASLRREYHLAGDDVERRVALAKFARCIAALNRRIRDANLQAPSAAFHRRSLRLEYEIEKALRE